MILRAVSAQAVLVLQMSNLLALDQSSTTTGYSVFKNGKPVIISHFTVTGELGERLEKIRNKIISLINQYEIDEVVFEDIQLQDMAGGKDVGIKTFKILAEVFGVVHELMNELNMDYTRRAWYGINAPCALYGIAARPRMASAAGLYFLFPLRS